MNACPPRGGGGGGGGVGGGGGRESGGGGREGRGGAGWLVVWAAAWKEESEARAREKEATAAGAAHRPKRRLSRDALETDAESGPATGRGQTLEIFAFAPWR